LNYKALLDKLGGPAYIYDIEKIRESYYQLKNSLPVNSIIFYSLKANPHPYLVKELLELGCYAEVCSIGELDVVLNLGHDKSKIIYTGPGKSNKEIKYAISNGIKLFSIESWNDLKKIFHLAKQYNTKVDGIIRINPELTIKGTGLNMTGVPSQFGIDERSIESIPEIDSLEDYISLKGFHIYTGTNIPSKELLLENFKNCIIISKKIARKLNISLEILDLGGGFSHPFARKGEGLDLSGVKDELEDFLDQELMGWRKGKPKIGFESGRYLVASSGKLITQVEDIKLSKEKIFYILESGINHLGGMSGLNRVPKVHMEFFATDESEGRKYIEEVNVVGPLCTPLDSLSRNITLPQANIGDILIVHNVGAYGLYASLLAFLSREIPIEVVVEGDSIKDISQLIIHRTTKGDYKYD
jgi:diaminopimelate decarboxylase